MTLSTLVSKLESRGVRLAVKPGGRLGVNAPPGVVTTEMRGALARFKDELLDYLRTVGEPDPPIDVPRDWHSAVAGLPHDRWVRWRARSGEIQSNLGHAPTADDIRKAERTAAAELLAEGVAVEPPAAPPALGTNTERPPAEARPTPPEVIRAGITAMVKAAGR
jgi:hypothetical protein